MELLDYFRILNYELHELRSKSKWEVLEEVLAGLNSDDVKTTLRHLRCFKMTLPLLQVLQKSQLIHLSLCYTQ